MTVLQIRLGHGKAVTDDAMGRNFTGWHPSFDDLTVWNAGRGVWKLDANKVIAQCGMIRIINLEGKIVSLGTINGFTIYGDRVAIEGSPFDSPLIGTMTPTPHPSRNAVHYAAV